MSPRRNSAHDAALGKHRDLIRQQATLARFGELALRSDDLDEILTEACRLAGQALGTDLAKVVELQADGKTLLVRAGVGWKPGVVGKATIMAEEDTSEGHALRTGEPMISPDIAKETRFRYSRFLIDNNVRAVANVLIIRGHGRQPFGILQIDSHVPRQFTESDTLFLRSYANLLAAAVDRIRVVEEFRDGEAHLRGVLEKRVAERTNELIEANGKLKAQAEERERVEETLRQSHKMEAVGQLTGGLAHDFNNLLAVISGNLELARLHADRGRVTELHRFIEPAMDSAKRATALIQRLLTFSRQQTLTARAVDVNGLIHGMEHLFRGTVGPAIQVGNLLASDLWPTLCDANQLENALLNLIINARDAMPDGGRVTIETRNETTLEGTAGTVSAGDYVVIIVADMGEGMAPEVVKRAFDPFFTTKEVGKGTGLGLSMVYGFIRQSGGQVMLSSALGRGTTLAIYLPRYRGAMMDEIALQAVFDDPSATRAGAAILVVDDEREVRDLIVAVLSDKGYTILQAVDGPAGLRIVQSDVRIDLLLTDVGLPSGMNGRQFAAAARERRPGLKVLFITGYAEGSFANFLMEPGTEVMMKPFALDDLSRTVNDLIASTLTATSHQRGASGVAQPE